MYNSTAPTLSNYSTPLTFNPSPTTSLQHNSEKPILSDSQILIICISAVAVVIIIFVIYVLRKKRSEDQKNIIRKYEPFKEDDYSYRDSESTITSLPDSKRTEYTYEERVLKLSIQTDAFDSSGYAFKQN